MDAREILLDVIIYIYICAYMCVYVYVWGIVAVSFISLKAAYRRPLYTPRRYAVWGGSCTAFVNINIWSFLDF